MFDKINNGIINDSKILPIIWKDRLIHKHLSKKSIYSRFIENADENDEWFDQLIGGMDRYITKIIITSNFDHFITIFNLIVDRYRESDGMPIFCCLIESKFQRFDLFFKYVTLYQPNKIHQFDLLVNILDLNTNEEDYETNKYQTNKRDYSEHVRLIKHYSDIDLFINNLLLEGYQFHSNREIGRLHRINFVTINILICCTAKSQNQLEELNNMLIQQFDMVNPMKNDYLIGTLHIYNYLIDPSDVQLEQSYETHTISEKCLSYELIKKTYRLDQSDMERINNMIKWFEVIGVTYGIKWDDIAHWYILNKFCPTDLNVDCILVYQADHKISEMKNILHEIDYVIKQNTSIKTERIVMKGERFAIGTQKVMMYYMILYQYYGSYKPWVNVRKFQTNGLWNSDDYYQIDKEYWMDHRVQITEHIMFFSDICLTQIKSNNMDKKEKKIVLIIGNLIPNSIKSYAVNKFIDHRIICYDSPYQVGDESPHMISHCIFWRTGYVPNINLNDSTKIINLLYLSDFCNGDKEVFEKYENLYIVKDIMLVDGLDFPKEGSDVKIIDWYHDYVDISIQQNHLANNLANNLTHNIDLLIIEPIELLAKDLANHLANIVICSADDENLYENVSNSKMVLTNDPKIALMCMSVQSLVLCVANIWDCGYLQPNYTYYPLTNGVIGIAEQIMIIYNKLEKEQMNRMLYTAYWISTKYTWHNLLSNILSN